MQSFGIWLEWSLNSGPQRQSSSIHVKYGFFPPQQSVPVDQIDQIETEEISNVAHSFLLMGTLGSIFCCSLRELIWGWCLKSNEIGPSIFIFQIVISEMSSHSHSFCTIIPLGFWLFPSPASPTSPRVLLAISPFPWWLPQGDPADGTEIQA